MLYILHERTIISERLFFGFKSKMVKGESHYPSAFLSLFRSLGSTQGMGCTIREIIEYIVCTI